MMVPASKTAAVAMIGRTCAIEFDSLLQFVRSHPAVRITGEFGGVDEALTAGLAETIPADVVLVLQEFSDQYSLDEANRLIGRMLFGRVFCCYGPWCQADGRSHDIWPVSGRMPVASAASIIGMELDGLLAGRLPQSPMSAAEEVFVHRSSQVRPLDQRSSATTFIISSEHSLRTTIDRFCRECGLKTQQFSMNMDSLRSAIQQTPVHPQVAILDLDPPDATLVSVHSELRDAFPNLAVLGMTVFPQHGFQLRRLHAIIDKTELLTQLHWHLGQLDTLFFVKT